MRAQGIVRHQLVGDLKRQIVNEPAVPINRGEFLSFGFWLIGQFGGFARDIGALGIGLAADRHIFARRHRQGTGGQPRNPGQQHGGAVGIGGGDADDQAGGRQYAVIGAEHGRAQPADALDEVPFTMSPDRHWDPS